MSSNGPMSASYAELDTAKVTVKCGPRKLNPDSNAWVMVFTREPAISDEYRRYQSWAIKSYLVREFDADNVRLNVQLDRLTVVAVFTKGW